MKYLPSVDVKWNLPTFASANISHLRSKYFTAKLFHLPKGQISLKKAQRDCVRLFFWQGREDSVSSLRRKAEFLISALLRSSVFRGSDSPPDCHSLPLPFESSQNCIPAKRKSPRKIVDFFFLAGAGGLEPATHGFGDRYSTNWATPLCTRILYHILFAFASLFLIFFFLFSYLLLLLLRFSCFLRAFML